MLVVGWLILGMALLAIEAGLLSLGAPQGQYVSILGAIRFNLFAQSLPFSTWPWGQESIAGALESAASGTAQAGVGAGLKVITGGLA